MEVVRLLLEHPQLVDRREAVDRGPGLRIDPCWVSLEVSLAALAQGRPADAEAALATGLTLFAAAPLDAAGPPPAGALDVMRQLAWLRFQRGDFAGALACSNRVGSHPAGRRPRDLANHGAILWALGRAQEGLQSLELAARLDPEEPYVRANLAPLRQVVERGRIAAPDTPRRSTDVAAPAPLSASATGSGAGSGAARARGAASRLRPTHGSSAPQLTLVSLLRDEEADRKVVPAGCLYLLGAARAAGWSGALLDRQLVSEDRFRDPSALVADLGDPGPVIGLSAMADRLPLLVTLLPALRQAFPDRVLLAGGPGPSSVAGPLMAIAPELDAVVCGEGEETLVEVLARLQEGGLEALRGCPGVRGRAKGGLWSGPPRARRLDLDGLPLPAYDLVDLQRYDDVTVITSRGCPHACTFCDASALWGRHRVERSMGGVLSELELLARKHGVEHVNIEDDTFLTPGARVRRFCSSLQERLPGLTWGCLGRADAIEPGLPELLAASGCRALFLGMESGSAAVLKAIRKGVRPVRALAGARLALNSLPVRAYFIWGFPDESWDDFLDTFSTAAALRSLGAEVGHSLLAPFPSTAIGRRWQGRLRLHEGLRVPCLMRAGDSPEELALIRAHPGVVAIL